MKTRVALSLLLVLSMLAWTATAQEKKEAAKEKPTAFEQFKQLAGEWVGKSDDGKDSHDVTVTYKVTSARSAVVETIMPGTDHEMVTVIHPDGDDLVLTHYCAVGNQPRMKASGKADGNKVAFQFTGATNMKSDKEFHMHNVTFTFIDKDTLKAEWTHYMDGKTAGTAVFNMKRKK